MWQFAIVITILFAGCSSASKPSSIQTSAEDQSAEIAKLERQCEQDAATRKNAEVARIVASGDLPADLEIQSASQKAQREISACRTEADRRNQKIGQREIDVYQRQAEEERERSALISILNASRIH